MRGILKENEEHTEKLKDEHQSQTGKCTSRPLFYVQIILNVFVLQHFQCFEPVKFLMSFPHLNFYLAKCLSKNFPGTNAFPGL